MTKLDLKKLARSFHYAFRGVIHLLTDQQNARIHASAAILVGILAYLLDITRLEAAVLFIAVIMVFAMEILNTAIENICDLVDEKDNEHIRKIKDGMAGSVLIATTIAVVVAFLIFLPHIKELFSRL